MERGEGERSGHFGGNQPTFAYLGIISRGNGVSRRHFGFSDWRVRGSAMK